MTRRCRHFALPGKCNVPTCDHYTKDVPLHVRMFGPLHDSALAAQIAKDDPQRYQQLRKLAQDAGLLPRDTRVACLTEDESEK